MTVLSTPDVRISLITPQSTDSSSKSKHTLVQSNQRQVISKKPLHFSEFMNVWPSEFLLITFQDKAYRIEPELTSTS
ncbi:hypothetical protein Tcan_18030 [Toxocara canis]|uniref:Uncharacterized protein n=1 Tax=Toxocara canis TaxID=6265 RepID=A0A0B2VJ67_TOXCA|nr:hypothetical protein Tcan_18030 [Toxocara canis]